jgi:hypothetical protein
MIEDDQDQGDQGAVPGTDDLHPYIVYRNPADDPILCALQEAVRRLNAEGKPLTPAEQWSGRRGHSD